MVSNAYLDVISCLDHILDLSKKIWFSIFYAISLKEYFKALFEQIVFENFQFFFDIWLRSIWQYHTLIKSCLIPNFFWKNRVFYVSKASQSQGMRGRFLLHKNLWNWLSPSWKYFLHPLAPKNNVLQGVCYVHGVLKNRCPFMMDFEICLILW